MTTLAGSGSGSWADGTGTAASFRSPYGVSVDSNGAVFVGDSSNRRIRKVSSSGMCIANKPCARDFLHISIVAYVLV